MLVREDNTIQVKLALVIKSTMPELWILLYVALSYLRLPFLNVNILNIFFYQVLCNRP